jgi:hypothetical protein
LGPDIKELNLKTLCMLTQLLISLSNPRVGPILEMQSYNIRSTKKGLLTPPTPFLHHLKQYPDITTLSQKTLALQ